MNLYRSFGNLMEAWVTEGAPEPDWPEPPSPPSDAETNVRSESVDSGVETASSDISFPTACASVDLDASPVLSFPAPLSSSSSPLMSNMSRVEQALLRVESFRLRRREEAEEVEEEVEVRRRRPLSSLLPARLTCELARGQRSASFVVRKTESPSLLVRHLSDTQKRPQSVCDRDRSDCRTQVPTGAEASELSPGLQYLEQVCQMLEDLAREQLHHHTLHTEEAAEEAAEETREEQEEQSCRGAKKTGAEPSGGAVQQRGGGRPFGHFRQRSASDTNLASLHLRRLKFGNREYNLSSHDLQEADEEDQENQDGQKDGTVKPKNHWLFKFGSLRRDEGRKSPQMQFEKSSMRRRMSQMFRKRRKTGPV